MIDYSTGRPEQSASAQEAAEYAKMSAPNHRYGLFMYAVVPTVMELRAAAQLGGGNSWWNKVVGKSIYGTGDPADFKDITKAEYKRLKAGKTIRGASSYHRTIDKAAKARGALTLQSGARAIGMATILDLGIQATGGAVNMIMSYRKSPKDIILKTSSGEFNDTNAAATQRQRAIQAIHNSQLTSRAALGNEASFLHI